MRARLASMSRNRAFAFVGILVALQAVVSLFNTLRSSANLTLNELAEDLVRSIGLLAIAGLYWLAFGGKIKGAFRSIVLVLTWLDLIVTGLLLILFGALFSRAFPVPLAFLGAAVLLAWASIGKTSEP